MKYLVSLYYKLERCFNLDITLLEKAIRATL